MKDEILQKYISVALLDFKILGYIPFKNKIGDKIRLFYLIFTTLFLNLIPLGLCCWQMVIVTSYRNVDALILYFLTLSAFFQCSFKILNTMWNINNFHTLNETIINITKDLIKDESHKKQIIANEQRNAKLYTLCRIMVQSLTISYTLQPLFSSERMLSYDIYFPKFLDWRNNNVAYWIVYVYEAGIILYLSSSNSLVEALCASYIKTFRGFMQVAVDEVDKLKEARMDDNDDSKEHDYERLNFIMNVFDDVVR